jgi:hypothetical protein
MLAAGCRAGGWLAAGHSPEAGQSSLGIVGDDRREQRANLRCQRALPFQAPLAHRAAGDVRGGGSLLRDRQGLVQVSA